MAIAITITNGTDTVTLTSSDALLLSWTPDTPGIDDTTAADGFQVELQGGNSAVDATIAKLEKLFQQARQRLLGGAAGIDWVYVKVTIDSATWRSPVQDGQVVIGGESWIKYERALGTREATVLVARAAWWESDTETEISLTNANGTDVTGGIYVGHFNDLSGSVPAKVCNYVEIAAAKVTGDLPAPARIKMMRNVPAANVQDVMVSLNAYSGPGSLAHQGAVTISAGSTTALAGTWGGNYQSKAGTSISVSMDITAQAASLQGAYYRVLARMSVTGACKIKLFCTAGDATAYGKQVILPATASHANFSWVDLGIIQIPAGLIPGVQAEAITLGWTVTADSSVTYEADCYQICPLDGWRRARLSSAVYRSNQYIYLDEILGVIYGAYGSYGTQYATVYGSPLKLFPNRLQRLYFETNQTLVPATAINTSNDNMSVMVSYRPRRRTL